MHPSQLDKIVGLAMLVAASVIFTYYTIWTLLIVRVPSHARTRHHDPETHPANKQTPPPRRRLPS